MNMNDTFTGTIPLQKSSGKRYWSETAFNWLERSQRRAGKLSEEPSDPTKAAWNFTRESTGFDFLDEAIKASMHSTRAKHGNRPPFLELIGKDGTTLALISVAARFVVSTRRSKFLSTSPESPFQPQAILMDSFHSFSMPQLVRIVRSALVLEMTHVRDTAIIDLEMEECLNRIHLIFVSDVTVAIAALEALRVKLKSMGPITNLVLWDEFLGKVSDTASKMEAIRQLTRLWHGTNNAFIMVASHRHNTSLAKNITCQIIFEQKRKESNLYLAKVCGVEFVVTMGTAGMLSG